jgi:hypothetical protein
MTALQYMIRPPVQSHITESYVSSPPALALTDECGDVWVLGFNNAPHGKVPGGEFAFDVLRNGMPVGEYASRIERRMGRIRIFTQSGWKRWTGSQFI